MTTTADTGVSSRDLNEFAGVNGFVWFIGVVEGRNDPLKVGRVQVRCYGWHSPTVPSESLPWAQVITPIHNAAMSSIGHSPTGLVEGSTVFGFFMDGKNAELPMILGSMPGIPGEGSGSKSSFADPARIYPTSSEIGFPDTPRLAYDRWQEDPITKAKNENRVLAVPTAGAPKLSKADSNSTEIPSTTWDEPEQRAGKPSAYPLNHVYQSEIGHAFEVDDTPGCERTHSYHSAGTFTEVQPDGTRVTKVVGSDFLIVVKDKNVSISGDCNVTIAGDARLRIDGDFITEVAGDYHCTVRGSRMVKIEGNDLLEVGSNATEVITGNATRMVGKSETSTVVQSSTETVGTNKRTTAIGEITTISGKSTTMTAGENINAAAGGTTNMNSQLLKINNSVEVTGDIDLTGTSTAAVDHLSNGVSGYDHKHNWQGLGPGPTSSPVA